MTSIIIPNINGDFYKETEEIFERILNCGITVCGFDTESTVQNSFKNEYRDKSTDCYVSIIQICINQNHGGVLFEGISEENTTDYTCYIIPIKQIFIKYKYFPKSMRKFFETKNIYKVGAGIREDVNRLKKFISDNLKLEFDGFIDLQDIARSIGCNSYSLDSLAQSYLNTNKSKSKLGNYENELTTDQLYYSSHDSYISLSIYLKMINPPIYNTENKNLSANKKVIFIDNDKEMVLKNIDINIESQELLTYFNNIKLLISKSCKYSTIYNSISTYKKWNIYNNDIKKMLLDKCLELLINQNIIIKINDNNYIRSNYKNINDIIYNKFDNLIIKSIPITGIKETSLINFLDTSINSLLIENITRKERVNNIIINLMNFFDFKK